MTVDTEWWSSPDWTAYEAACGVIVSREQELREATWTTRVVDLSAPVPILRANVRKSYRQLIRHAEQAYTIEVCDETIMDLFQVMHAHVAGRQTRPLSTWKMMERWVKEGKLIVIGAREGYAWRGLIAIYRWNRHSYYGHSAVLKTNLTAALVWHGMLKAKTLGATTFELGWQGHDLTPKGRSLDFFKSGFGGVDLPFATQETYADH